MVIKKEIKKGFMLGCVCIVFTIIYLLTKMSDKGWKLADTILIFISGAIGQTLQTFILILLNDDYKA